MPIVHFFSAPIRAFCWIGVSAAAYSSVWMPARLSHSPIKTDGTSFAASERAAALGGRAAVSRTRRPVSCSGLSAGFRSSENSTRSPSIRASTARRLRRRTTGPLTPLGVNSISPNSSATDRPLISSSTEMLRSVRPAIGLGVGRPVISGVSDGRIGTIVCPRRCARR